MSCGHEARDAVHGGSVVIAVAFVARAGGETHPDAEEEHDGAGRACGSHLATERVSSGV